ncbi:mucin-5AC isoform X2 [Anopheles moucheti]|uniref:mucin-5AC isoform X2 n=1 Tax=Anopheles moucheti TaxID=186751 RepID=UPI0022F08486|nr:mucin-5AC isoform X2 [Anopheles moucheti]
MAKAESIHNGIKTDATDDVEKSLELLDKVLSEFEEEPDRTNHHHNHHHHHHHPAVEPDSPSQGHQSEDDGYMSMNGRRAKFVPDFQPTDEATAPTHPQVLQLHQPSHHQQPQQQHSLPVPTDESYSPPSPEEAERIISNLLPRISPNTSPKRRLAAENGQTEWRSRNQSIRTSDAISIGDSDTSGDNKPSSHDETIITTKSPTQTTLPKTRPPNAMPQRYASLPCSSPPKLQDLSGSNDTAGGSLDGGRNKLGIGISAVHDAVLRGMARLPEPILNEHPVTIYPGRASPTRRMPPRTLSGSMERHRFPTSDNSTSTSQENSSPENNESEYNESSLSPTHGHLQPLQGGTPVTSLLSRIFHQNATGPPPSSSAAAQHHLHHGATHRGHRNPHGPGVIPGLPSRTAGRPDSDDERFSDDSLEESSLPPPPGPPTVPPPPSLSAPVTPSKRHSIAWEVNLDDPASFGDPLIITPKSSTAVSSKVIGRRKPGPKHATSSQSSLESTPSNVKSESNEWPDPPDIPICSTEDEAASIYSDSDDLIPHIPDINGRGTYIIRKGRRQRQRLASLESEASNNGILAGPDTTPSSQRPDSLGDDHILRGLPSPVFPASMITPKSRHSIDLGLSAAKTATVAANVALLKSSPSVPQKLLPNAVLSPRSRLSLDLSSPTTSELSTNVIKITTPTGSYPSPVSAHHHASSPLGTPTAPLLHHGPALNGLINNGPLVVGVGGSNSLSKSAKAPTTVVNVSSNGGAASTSIVNVGSGPSGANQPQSAAPSQPVVSARYTEFKTYSSTFDALQALDNSASGANGGNGSAGSTSTGTHLNGCGSGAPTAGGSDNPLLRVSSLPTITPSPLTSSATAEGLATPRRELAPPIEEDEEADSDTQRGAPLRKIEDNISALLRGDISVARVADIPPARRPLGFRLGVHKSESAKEMLLSQAGLGPLPPSPPSSSPEPDSDEFPPLPPSPTEEPEVMHQMHGIRISSRNRGSNGAPNGSNKHDQLIHGYREEHPPAIPPHRGPSINTLKTRSMDAGFSKSYRNGSFGSSTSPHAPGTLPPDLPGCNSRRRVITGGYQKRTAQSPREERSLQTSCSLPETPIFARGCDIPRTPHRRAPEVPPHGSGSRTAPRTNSTTSSLGSSVVGISASTTIGSRQRSISQALANGEMLRLAGGPARGWYPKQRHPRPASTENLDRLHPQGSLRAWEAAGTGSRKPLTLPPNLTPKFFNKSPREALRRVTSLLIRKGNSGTKEKEPKKDKDKEQPPHHHSQHPQQYHYQQQQQQHHHHRDSSSVFLQRSPGSDVTDSRSFPQHSSQHTTPTTQKKKGFFKSFWKKSRHYSLEKQ